jgi:hypothetical protein
VSNFQDDYLDQIYGKLPTDFPMTGGVSLAKKVAPQKTDYRSAYVSQLEAMSQKALTSGYGGNAQQAWQNPPPVMGNPESAREFRARSGRISSRVAPGAGSGPGGGLVSGGMAGSARSFAETFPVAPGQRPGESGFIGPIQSGRVAGGMATIFPQKPAPSWQSSTADERAQMDKTYGPKFGVTRITPAVSTDPRKFADKLFA